MTRIFRPLPFRATARLLSLAFLLCLAALPLGAGRAVAVPGVPSHSFVGVRSAILYDLDNDAILFEQNADERIPPASLTKVLSMFLALDHIGAGHAAFESQVHVSRVAARTGGSRMGLSNNERLPLEKLLMGMAVSSGNDASMAVAEFVGGSAPAFVNMMNVKARQLGMRDSRFYNPHGLPARNQYTTARDMLTLARAYLKTYPWALRFHNTQALNHQGRVTRNRNPLLGRYPGADGLKTGWINASGYNLIFTASRGEKRLLAVILGAPDERMRGSEARRLLDAGFQVCDNRAVSVAAALTLMPLENYRLNLRKNARAAARQTVQGGSPVRGRGKDVKNRQHKNRRTDKQRASRQGRQSAQGTRAHAG